MLHGANGEDGRMQGLLEMAKIPYVGCGVLSSAMCMDKVYTRTLLDHAGIKGTKWDVVNKFEIKDIEASCKRVAEKLSFPIFSKPANAGSSVGISKCNNRTI